MESDKSLSMADERLEEAINRPSEMLILDPINKLRCMEMNRSK